MSGDRARDSHDHPIRVDFLYSDVLNLPGRLGMTILPGVKDPGPRNRELDLTRLVGHYGADVEDRFLFGFYFSIFELLEPLGMPSMR